MTAKELIEVLQKLDQNKLIFFEDGEGYTDYPVEKVILVDNDYYLIQ